jgi:hypothetical protein
LPANGLSSQIIVKIRSRKLFGPAIWPLFEPLLVPVVVPAVIFVELDVEMNGSVAFESSRGP